MTTPVVTPSKLKTYVGLAGSLLAFAIPMLLSVQNALPEPWPAVIGAVIAVATATGIYHAPYKPPNTVLVADPNPPRPPTPGSTGTAYLNPWK